jgi:hypothetical protein
MATVALIKRTNDADQSVDWVPSVVGDIQPGDVYRLIVNGVPQDQVCKALGHPAQVMQGKTPGWVIEHEVIDESKML